MKQMQLSMIEAMAYGNSFKYKAPHANRPTPSRRNNNRLLNRYRIKNGFREQLHATKGWRKVERVN